MVFLKYLVPLRLALIANLLAAELGVLGHIDLGRGFCPRQTDLVRQLLGFPTLHHIVVQALDHPALALGIIGLLCTIDHLFGEGMDIDQIEYAAEVALEHHLGLTCDPIAGLVQIPCIERNAVAAMRAINATSLANFLTYTRRISFDMVVKTMYQTGKDMPWMYRETAIGGLAKEYNVISQK